MTERNLKEVLLDLLSTHHLLPVTEIMQALARRGKNYNKTSIYRALDQLVETGKVCRHFFEENEALYELQADHHTHLLCQSCGKVTSGLCDYRQPAQVGGFRVNHHHLTLVGTCGSCIQIGSK